MEVLLGLLPVFFVMAMLMGALALVLWGSWRFIKHVGQKTTKAWSEVAEALGLEFSQDNERRDPFITGTLHDVEVEVHLETRSYISARHDRANIRHKLSTQVEAKPDSRVDFWAVAKVGKSVMPPDGMIESQDGTSQFLEKYQIFLPESSTEGPDASLQEALLKQETPVSIVHGKALWRCSGIAVDQDRLTKAIKECATIARRVDGPKS